MERVEKGQPLGFAQEIDGAVVAVAGETTLPLQPGPYTWERLPIEGCPTWRARFRERVFDGTRRAGNVLLVVAVIAVGLAFAIAYGMASKPIGY